MAVIHHWSVGTIVAVMALGLPPVSLVRAAAASQSSSDAQISGAAPENAVLTPGTPLPETTAGLLAELRSHRQDIERLIGGGYLGGVWVPAMRSKDLALALEKQVADLDAAERPIAAEAIKQVVISAWQMDAAGDLGDKQQTGEAYATFASAVTQITDIYEPR